MRHPFESLAASLIELTRKIEKCARTARNRAYRLRYGIFYPRQALHGMDERVYRRFGADDRRARDGLREECGENSEVIGRAGRVPYVCVPQQLPDPRSG